MAGLGWFEAARSLEGEHLVFAETLRARAAHWTEHHDTWLGTWNGDGRLVAGLDIDDEGANRTLLSVGVHLRGNTLQADELHNQLSILPEIPTSLAMTTTGPIEVIANRAADWFESVLQRPVDRWEWTNRGQVYAYEYVFADTAEGFSQMFNKELAPWGLRWRLARRGYVSPKGWVEVRGIGEPDRAIHIRGICS
ncbi:hypothetical protein AB0H88_38055 [Nonomuraea sp. NPDC050680]|uniref:hypothetical protein n=1 Tax=Nonomuraea sp. NPDC050680 TaxID=3154630 RepID=UPI0033EC0989